MHILDYCLISKILKICRQTYSVGGYNSDSPTNQQYRKCKINIHIYNGSHEYSLIVSVIFESIFCYIQIYIIYK